MKKIFLSTRELCFIGMFTALTAILSQIAFVLPLSPVPIAFGNLAVLIAGMILKPKAAAFSQIAYLLLGSVGIPVFANFKGGLNSLIGPTGGYLFSYVFMAFFISFSLNFLDKKAKNRNKYSKYLIPVLIFLILCISMIICYTTGTLWFAFVMGKSIRDSLALTVYPYIFADSMKIIFSVAFIFPVRNRLIQ